MTTHYSEFNISHNFGLKFTKLPPLNPTFWGLSNNIKSGPNTKIYLVLIL